MSVVDVCCVSETGRAAGRGGATDSKVKEFPPKWREGKWRHWRGVSTITTKQRTYDMFIFYMNNVEYTNIYNKLRVEVTLEQCFPEPGLPRPQENRILVNECFCFYLNSLFLSLSWRRSSGRQTISFRHTPVTMWLMGGITASRVSCWESIIDHVEFVIMDINGIWSISVNRSDWSGMQVFN